jgi:hypothetical protein
LSRTLRVVEADVVDEVDGRNACSIEVGDAAGFLLLLQVQEAVADGWNACSIEVGAAAWDTESSPKSSDEMLAR